MAIIRIELWRRESFSMPNPVCDLCSKPLTDFPAIVVHQPFDYILIRLESRSGYVMRGGLALCSKCFVLSLKEYLEKGDNIIIETEPK